MNSIPETSEKNNPSDENSSKKPPKKRFALPKHIAKAAPSFPSRENFSLIQRNGLDIIKKSAILITRDSEDMRELCSVTAVPPRADVGGSVFLPFTALNWYTSISITSFSSLETTERTT